MLVKNRKQKPAVEGISTHTKTLLFGGARCVSGDTILDGTNKPIKQLSIENKPIEILTTYGKVCCNAPFYKGKDLLYKVEMENNKTIEVTNDHRFYTLDGWKQLSDIKVNDFIGCLPSSHSFSFDNQLKSSVSLLQTNLDISHQVPQKDDYHLNHKVLDCLYDYYMYLYQYDEQPHFLTISDLICLAYAFCVIKHNHNFHESNFYEQDYHIDHPLLFEVKHNLGQLFHQFSLQLLKKKPEDILNSFYNKIYEQFPKIRCIFDPTLLNSNYLQECHVPTHHIYYYLLVELLSSFCLDLKQLKSNLALFQLACKFRKVSSPQNEVSSLILSDLSCNNFSSDSPLISNLDFSKIKSITPTTTKDYYTITVPFSEQYFANGILNHNSGKTFIAIHVIVTRAIMYPKSTHLIIRRYQSSLRKTIWGQTIPKVLDTYNIRTKVKKELSNMTVIFPNGSKIICMGADNPKTMDKILGIECCTVLIDEASEIAYDQYELICSRLAEKIKGCTNRVILCCNPTTKKHWLYKYFIEKRNPYPPEKALEPETANDIFTLQINPEDNIENLPEGYIETLDKSPDRHRKRFFLGEFSSDVLGALWKYEWIDEHRKTKPLTFERIVIGVDPAVTSGDNSDNTGIIVCGKNSEDYYVLRDETFKGSPKEIVNKVVALRRLYRADRVIVETNQGGDFLLNPIYVKDPSCPVKGVHQKHGKLIRAEPISFLYERSMVHHCDIFPDLEGEMLEYNGTGSSPDRLDALVIALSELSFEQEQELDLTFGDRAFK